METETSSLQPQATNPSHFTYPVAELNQAKTIARQQERKKMGWQLAMHTSVLLQPQIQRLPLLSLTRNPALLTHLKGLSCSLPCMHAPSSSQLQAVGDCRIFKTLKHARKAKTKTSKMPLSQQDSICSSTYTLCSQLEAIGDYRISKMPRGTRIW